MLRAVVISLSVLVLASCGDGDAPPSAASDPPTAEPPLPEDPTVDDLARLVGCDETTESEDDYYLGPLRGGAASDVVFCTLDGDEVHLFVRASTDAPPGVVAEHYQGGTIENIDRLVATGHPGACGSFVAVGETWFALAASAEVLDGVATSLGGAVRELLPTGPPASYVPPGC